MSEPAAGGRWYEPDEQLAVDVVLNGSAATLRASPRWTLADAVRAQGLTGTHLGCEHGVCGACTVLLDGAAIRSCVTPVAEVAGKPIATIEGLEENGRLHPVQQAFLDTGAMQCGYCIPGMILGAVSLLRRRPQPTDAEIVQGLDDHICRCGTYPRILAAVKKAAGR